MKQEKLYKELAKYYDLIYHWKDYKNETKKIKSWISKYKKSGGKELLDVACGTGKHLQFLKNNFNCVGLDLSSDMLRVAKSKVKGVSFKQGDMADFNLNKKFDVVLCLFSSIIHLKNYANLRKAINNLSKHLKSGGVLILESFIEKSDFKEGHVYLNSFDGKDVKIARVGTSKLTKNGIMLWDTHYIIGKDSKVIHLEDSHELMLFEKKKIHQIMAEFGLKVKIINNGLMRERAVFIAVKHNLLNQI